MLHELARLDIKEAAFARRSAKQEPWQVHYVRPLTDDDLILAHSMIARTPDPKAPLAQIRNPHHALAKALAEGKSPVEVSAVYGYTTSRIRTLQSDPAFRELITYYEEQTVMERADISAQIRHVTLTAASLLQERLEDTPEEFSVKELHEILKAGADRLGHGPTSKVVHFNDPSKVIEALRNAMGTNSQIIPRAEIEAEFTEVNTSGLEADDEPTPESKGPVEGRDQE